MARDLFSEIMSGIEEVNEHRAGKRTLRTVTVKHEPIDVSSDAVREIREAVKMSQSVFADALRMNARTLQAWENGRSKVPDSAAVLLTLVRRYPDTLERIADITTKPSAKGALRPKAKRPAAKAGRAARE